MKKLKVLHIINSMQPGGAEILLTNSLAPGGLAEYFENHLAFFMKPSYLLKRLDTRVRVHFLDYKGMRDLGGLLRRIRKLIKENQIDLVHSHLNPAGWYTHLVCPRRVVQLHTIHTTYSMDNDTLKKNLFLERILYLTKKATNLILLSEYTKSDFLNALNFKGRTYVLNNFVSDVFFTTPHKEYKSQKSSLRIMAAGSLKPVKNFEYLAVVFEYLKEYDISADIYGSGDKKNYETLIEKKQVRLKMMGPVTNIESVMTQYDLFIMPSLFEGFPLVVFEAMACGLPLLLSDIAPVKNVVKDNALYFSLTDPKSVAEILLSIYNNEIDVNSRAEKARHYAELTVKKNIYIEKLRKIYAAVS